MEYNKRLMEIADTKFGELSDDQVLQLLAERKQLDTLRAQYEQAQEEQVALTKVETEKQEIEQELERLNMLISPDKQDEELLRLVEERKILEAKLEAAVNALGKLKKENIPVPVKEVQESSHEVVLEPVVTSAPAETEATLAPADPLLVKRVMPETASKKVLQGSVEDVFGREKIGEVAGGGSELAIYLDQIKNDVDSIGKILNGLPAGAKKDKTFMLEVAKIDPAYAMHYADKDVLKTNEDFNLSVVAMKNERKSGSVLAEMLPEARTGKVVLAAVKQDYNNVRFVQPQMAEYDEIMEKAKKMALDKIKEMKESVDAISLVPKILQKDAAFMKKVAEVSSLS